MCWHDGTACLRRKRQRNFWLVADRKPGQTKWQHNDQLRMKLLCWLPATRPARIWRNAIGLRRFVAIRGSAKQVRRRQLRRDRRLGPDTSSEALGPKTTMSKLRWRKVIALTSNGFAARSSFVPPENQLLKSWIA